MRRFSGSWLFILAMILLDWYVFQAVRLVCQGAPARVRYWVYGIYWFLSGCAVLTMILLPYLNYDNWPKAFRTYLFAMILGLFLSKLLAAVFLLVDDIRRLMQWAGGRLYYQFIAEEKFQSAAISRSTFMSWLGLGIGGTLFGTLVYGFSNKYNYQVRNIKLSFPNLPAAFKGFRVVQISDVHSGSFGNKQAVEKGIDLILAQQPDLILFTGDLVNDRASEMQSWLDVFSRLKAKHGVYSTLGNHDYGDYAAWPDAQAKTANLDRLKQMHAGMGWRLLMNEHVPIERSGEKIGLLGVENWSAKGSFPKYGRLKDAYAGADQYPFKILMTHDPSHWDAEVRTSYSDIDLTLSGHTHGMQFGVELPWFRWSPVKYVYKQWAGLYEEGAQKLYVNRGYGFIGYPGRVGILPEITVFELV